MHRVEIQSGDFNFFKSPSAVASSASSLKLKSMEWKSSWAAFAVLSKNNHRVLHAFWRCFVSELASGFPWTFVYTERRFGELSKNVHSCHKFVSTLATWAMSATECVQANASLWQTQCMLNSVGQCLSHSLAARPPVLPVITDVPSLARETIFDISMPSCWKCSSRTTSTVAALALVDSPGKLSIAS